MSLGLIVPNFLKTFLLAESKAGWKRSRVDQEMTWHRCMKESTKRSVTVGSGRLRGPGTRDPQYTWLNSPQ